VRSLLRVPELVVQDCRYFLKPKISIESREPPPACRFKSGRGTLLSSNRNARYLTLSLSHMGSPGKAPEIANPALPCSEVRRSEKHPHRWWHQPRSVLSELATTRKSFVYLWKLRQRMGCRIVSCWRPGRFWRLQSG